MKRGENYEGGKYVGTSAAGVEWVAYRGEAEFQALCERFDERQRRTVKLTRAAREAAEADTYGRDRVPRVVWAGTKVTGTVAELRELAEDFQMMAEEIDANGVPYHADMDFRMMDRATKNATDARIRWAQKIRARIG